MVIAIGLVASSLSHRALGAQAVIKGYVRAVSTGAVLPTAEVLIDDLRLKATTNERGYFYLSNIPLGVHELRVRRIGFTGAYATLRVEAPDSLMLDFALEAWVPELEPLIVNSIGKRNPKLIDFYEREAVGFGRFILPEDVRKGDKQGRTLVDLLRERGIEIEQFIPGPGGSAVAIGKAAQTFSRTSSRCVMSVFLDGVATPDANIAVYDLSRLEAVEVYKNVGSAPIQYTPTGSVCGLILLWSRVG